MIKFTAELEDLHVTIDYIPQLPEPFRVNLKDSITNDQKEIFLSAEQTAGLLALSVSDELPEAVTDQFYSTLENSLSKLPQHLRPLA